MIYIYFNEDARRVVISPENTQEHGKEIGKLAVYSPLKLRDERFFVTSLLRNAGYTAENVTIITLPPKPRAG
jgi:hypothetical protein